VPWKRGTTKSRWVSKLERGAAVLSVIFGWYPTRLRTPGENQNGGGLENRGVLSSNDLKKSGEGAGGEVSIRPREGLEDAHSGSLSECPTW